MVTGSTSAMILSYFRFRFCDLCVGKVLQQDQTWRQKITRIIYDAIVLCRYGHLIYLCTCVFVRSPLENRCADGQTLNNEVFNLKQNYYSIINKSTTYIDVLFK